MTAENFAGDIQGKLGSGAEGQVLDIAQVHFAALKVYNIQVVAGKAFCKEVR